MTLATTASDAGPPTSTRTLLAGGTLRRAVVTSGSTTLVQSCAINALGAPDLSRLTLYAGAVAGSVDAHAFLPASAVAPGHLPPGGDVAVTAAPDNVNGDCGAHTGSYALGCQAGTCSDGCLAFPASAAWDASFDLTVRGIAAPSATQAGGAGQSDQATCGASTESGQRVIHATLTIVNPGAGGAAPALPAAPGAAPATPAAPASGPAAPTGSTPIVSPPARPDPAALAGELARLARAVGRRCGDDRLGSVLDGAGAGGGARLPAGLSGAELLGARTLDCARAFVEWRATGVRIAGEPFDARYSEIPLPRAWPAATPSAACPATARFARCRAVVLALERYAKAGGRRASLTEVLAIVAERAAAARAAYRADPVAPAAVELQTALSRAYSGVLVSASRVELRAARALTLALRAAGVGALRFGPAARQQAAALLTPSGPPAWLVSRLAGVGLGSAAKLRSQFRSLVKRAAIRRTATVGTLFRGRVAPEIPAESFLP